MNRVSAELAVEVRVRFQQHHWDALAGQEDCQECGCRAGADDAAGGLQDVKAGGLGGIVWGRQSRVAQKFSSSLVFVSAVRNEKASRTDASSFSIVIVSYCKNIATNT